MSADLSSAHHDGANPGPGPFGEVLHAALRGAIAAMAMTGMRAFTIGAGLVEESPPNAIVRQKSKGVFHLVPRKKRRAGVELMHWGYGTAGGALFALLPEDVRRQPWAGPVYGIVLLFGFEAVQAPLMGLEQAHKPRPVERLALGLDHALYGFVLSEMRRRPQG